MKHQLPLVLVTRHRIGSPQWRTLISTWIDAYWATKNHDIRFLLRKHSEQP